jgi:RNA polymerase sigma factor (sigma-70 family)
MARIIANAKSRGRHYQEDVVSEAYLAVADGAVDRSGIENAVRRSVREEWALEDGYASLELADSLMRQAAPEKARPDLWGALAVLDERQRAVVILTFWEGLSQENIAAVVGVGQQHVSRILDGALYAMQIFLTGMRKTHGQNAVGK